MFDASRLASSCFSKKPSNVAYSSFSPQTNDVTAVSDAVDIAITQSAYSAGLSLAEACIGIKAGSSTWPVVQLYYSAFYSLKCLFLVNNLVPFHNRGEMMLDLTEAAFIKGGKSSHVWNWGSIKSVSRLSTQWYLSQDAMDAYDGLRNAREAANYTQSFPEPEVHHGIVQASLDIPKQFRTYRDDADFFYTYLADHRMFAFPVQLAFCAENSIRRRGLCLGAEKLSFLRRKWIVKDRCPFDFTTPT